MLTLTDGARLAIRSLISPADAPDDAGVRIAATGGSDGQGPELALSIVPAPAPGDEVVEDHGARVFLDATAAQLLGDETLDAQIDAGAEQVNFFFA